MHVTCIVNAVMDQSMKKMMNNWEIEAVYKLRFPYGKITNHKSMAEAVYKKLLAGSTDNMTTRRINSTYGSRWSEAGLLSSMNVHEIISTLKERLRQYLF